MIRLHCVGMLSDIGAVLFLYGPSADGRLCAAKGFKDRNSSVLDQGLSSPIQ